MGILTGIQLIRQQYDIMKELLIIHFQIAILLKQSIAIASFNKEFADAACGGQQTE